MIEKNDTGDLQLFKNLQYKKYEELKVAAFENKEGDSRNNEMTIEEEIDLVIEHTKQKIYRLIRYSTGEKFPRKYINMR